MKDRATLLVGLAAIAMSLTGCTPTVIWQKPGASTVDFNRDSYECERDIRQSGYFGGGLTGLAAREEFGERCMIARGWKPVQGGLVKP